MLIKDGQTRGVAGGDPNTTIQPASVAELLPQRANGTGAIHVILPEGTVILSLGDLLDRAMKVLGGLRENGLGPGDRLILALDDPRHSITALWACFLGGIIPVPGPSTMGGAAGSERRRRQLEYLDTPTDQAPILSTRESLEMPATRQIHFETIENSKSAFDVTPGSDDDLALLMATSGSSAEPKLVRLTHRNIIASVVGSIQANDYSDAEVSLNWLPLHHIGALMRSIREVHLGCTQIQISTSRVSSNLLTWLDLMSGYRATLGWAPNSAFATLVSRENEIKSGRWDLRSVRSLHSSGEAVTPVVMSRFAELMKPHGLSTSSLHTAWGMTEACFATCSHDYLDRVENGFAESGAPVRGIQLRIVDENDQGMDEGKRGLLQIRGTIVSPGYENLEEDQAAFTPDGWLRTGDLASIRGGRLTIEGRAKEMIKIGGVAVSSVEIENALLQIPSIEPGGIAACGVCSEKEGESLAVFVSSRQTSTIHEIRIASNRAIGVAPRFVIPLDAADFPRSPAGKTLRGELSRRFMNGDFDEWRTWPFDIRERPTWSEDQPIPGISTLASRIERIFCETLHVASIDHDANLFSLGGTSLQVARASTELASLVPGRPCTIGDLFHAPTPASLARRLLETKPDEAIEAARRRGERRRQSRGLN